MRSGTALRLGFQTSPDSRANASVIPLDRVTSRLLRARHIGRSLECYASHSTRLEILRPHKDRSVHVARKRLVLSFAFVVNLDGAMTLVCFVLPADGTLLERLHGSDL